MAVTLHRCSGTFIKGPHPCWQVQKALDAAGVAYETETHPAFPRSRRKKLEELTGQSVLPALQLEDGTVLREESKDLIARINDGRLTAP